MQIGFSLTRLNLSNLCMLSQTQVEHLILQLYSTNWGWERKLCNLTTTEHLLAKTILVEAHC